jgi:hypothetical protein
MILAFLFREEISRVFLIVVFVLHTSQKMSEILPILCTCRITLMREIPNLFPFDA